MPPRRFNSSKIISSPATTWSGGIGLRGTGVSDPATQAIVGGSNTFYAKGTIRVSGVPDNADIVAAFLYWQALEGSTQPAAATGTFLGHKITGKQIAPAGALGCWSSGGGAGNGSGAQTLRSYRADVMRFLPVNTAPNGAPIGQRRVNGVNFIVALPDTGGGGTNGSGTANQATLLQGASLVVVYRDPGQPLRSVVLYDGGYTMDANTPVMTQTLQGFYQASNVNPVAQMTHIVGDGDTSFKETLTVNGSVVGTPSDNPFTGAQGRAWDNLTLPVPSMRGGDASVSTRVDPVLSSVDCLSWTAIVFSTTVQDTDRDGLLDVWETTTGGVLDATDPAGVKHLPDLKAMGANPAVPDVFVEIDYLTGASHSHLPVQAALDRVGKAYKARGINMHFDAGLELRWRPVRDSRATGPGGPGHSGIGPCVRARAHQVVSLPDSGNAAVENGFPEDQEWQSEQRTGNTVSFRLVAKRYFPVRSFCACARLAGMEDQRRDADIDRRCRRRTRRSPRNPITN